MSAPRTNIEKQMRHHRGPLIGMAVIVVLVLLGFIWWIYDEADDPVMPGDTPVEEMTESPPADAAPAGTTTVPAPATETAPQTAPAPSGG